MKNEDFPTPKVSVIIPCYNLGQFLSEAVNSVLNQTFQDFEIIIVNDGSTDEFTIKLLENSVFPKTTIYHTSNQGLPATRNYGIERATGKYICCLDADDKFHPEFLKKTVAVLEEDLNEEYGIATTNYEIFEKSVSKIETKDFNPSLLAVENCLHVASLFRKKCWKLVGGYATNLSGYQDWNLWLGIIAAGYKWFTIKEFLFFYRDRTDSMLKFSDAKRNDLVKLIISNNKEFYKNNSELIINEFIISTTKNLAYNKDLLVAIDYYKGQMGTTQSQLASTQSQLASTQSQLAATQSQLASSQSQLASTQSQLGSSQSQLTSTQSELANVQIRLNQFEGIINKFLPLGSLRRKIIKYLINQLRAINKSIKSKKLKLLNLRKYKITELIILSLKKIFPDNTPIGKTLRIIRQKIVQTKLVLKMKFFPQKAKNKRKLQKVYNEKWPSENPLISIIIPCFNYGQYVEQAIDSVLDQTFQNYEIIVVEGGSTDNITKDILKNLSKPKTTIYYREGRHLVGDNRNFGIGLAKGKYICCLDADDILAPTYLEKALFLLEFYKNDVVYPSVQCFGEETFIWHADPTTFEELLNGNAVATVAVFIKEAWEQVKGYKDWPVGEGYVFEDWEFWIRIMGHGFRFKNIREPLMYYRVHKNGLTGKNTTMRSKQQQAIYQENSSLRQTEFAKIRTKKNKFYYYVDNPVINLQVSKHKKRILLALPFMIIGGADTILLRIFNSLKIDYDISIITTLDVLPEFGDNTNEYMKITNEIYHINKFLINDEEKKDFIHYLIGSRQIDLVFIVGCEFVYKMLPEIKSKNPDIKIIDQLFNEFGHMEHNRRYASLIDLNIVATKIIKEVIVEKYGEQPDKVELIIHGIDPKNSSCCDEELSSDSLFLKDNTKFKVSYFGRFSSEKAPDTFIEIIHKINMLGYADFQAFMIGNGPEYSQAVNMIKEYSLQDKIYAPGFVDDVKPYLAQTDILVVPSRIEGLPIIILEALSYGIPVVASDIGGIPTVIIDGYNGYICKASDSNEFVSRIIQLFNDQILLASMKQNALHYFTNNISEEKMITSYKSAIQKIL